MGSLPYVSPTTVYVYKVLLIYSPLTLITGQPAGQTIQRTAEVFLQLG